MPFQPNPKFSNVLMDLSADAIFGGGIIPNDMFTM